MSSLSDEAAGNASIASRLLELYPPHSKPKADNIDRKGWYSSDRMMCGLRRTAAGFAAVLPRVHLYRYDYWFQSNKSCTAVANYHDAYYGSMHQDEVSFVFGQPIYMNIGFTNCSAPGWSGFNPICLGCRFDAKEDRFAKTMGRLWTSFAAAKATEWPRFGASGGKNVFLTPTKPWAPDAGDKMLDKMIMRTEEALGRQRQCELWDEIAAMGDESGESSVWS